ncbi:MAG: hypothetical protein AAFX53_06680 [Bacteroidota bacterium]
MIRFKSQKRFVILAFLVLMGVYSALRAQEKHRYLGPLQLGNYQGEADYSYSIVEQDTVLDGPFTIKRSSLEALLKEEDLSFDISGNFEKDYPQGFWQLRFGEFRSDSQSQVVDYQYRVLISGTQEEASGLLDKGRPDGPWTFAINRIRDSEVDTALFKSSILFESGVPQRNFRIEDQNHILVGRFLRNGLAHDEWSLYAIDEMGEGESWFFNEGLLQKIQLRRNGEILEFPIHEEQSDSIKTIDLGLRYLKALGFSQFDSDTLQLTQTQIPDLLGQNERYYKKIDDLLSLLGNSSFSPSFKVRLPYFPLDSTELRQSDSIAHHFKRAKTIGDGILNNTRLNILKLSDREALFLHNVVAGISKDFLDPLGRLADYNREGILEFVPRKELLLQLWPTGKPSVAMEVDVSLDGISQKRTFVLPGEELSDFSGNTLLSAVNMARYANKVVDSVQQVLADKLTREKQEQELISLEEKLIAQGKGLHVLLDSLSGNVPMSHKDILLKIKALTDHNLSEYAQSPEANDKLARAQQLVDCHTRLEYLAKIIGQLPAQEEEIRQKYQDAVWNPFTATVMNEEVKKRITAAYSKILIPYYLAQVGSQLNCENVEQWIILFENTYQRVLQLRDEDTAKLERKLRRENDPLTVMELFGINAIHKGDKE